MRGFLKDWSQKARVQTGLACYYWPQVIGDSLKDKIEVSQVKSGILWVKTPDPALAHNLTFFKSEIITKYQRILGENFIRNVRITVGALSSGFDQKTAEKTGKEPVQVDDPPLPVVIEGIGDPALRQAFSRFYYAHQACRRGFNRERPAKGEADVFTFGWKSDYQCQ